MSPAKSGSLFSPTFRFPDTASSSNGSRPVTPSINGCSLPASKESSPAKAKSTPTPHQLNHSIDVNHNPSPVKPEVAESEESSVAETADDSCSAGRRRRRFMSGPAACGGPTTNEDDDEVFLSAVSPQQVKDL